MRSDYSEVGRRSIDKSWSREAQKCCLYLDIFSWCENQCFSLSGSRCMSDAIASTGADGGNYFGTADAV